MVDVKIRFSKNVNRNPACEI